ncbi:MAG: LutC/YkgG family protein [Solirubrobacterales bacterium]
MSNARSAIFDGIRRSLHRGPLTGVAAEAVSRRLAEPRANVVPARGRGAGAELVERFAAMVIETQASLARVAALSDVPASVAAWLAEAGLPLSAVAAPALAALDWAGTGLDVRFGAAAKGDMVSLTPAFRGVAETGTLVLTSGPERPTTLNFMPDVHVVLVRAGDVVGCYEDAWVALRAAGAMPRTVNWITGPSRTADIEQSLLLGAHGPRRLHVVLIDGP